MNEQTKREKMFIFECQPFVDCDHEAPPIDDVQIERAEPKSTQTFSLVGWLKLLDQQSYDEQGKGQRRTKSEGCKWRMLNSETKQDHFSSYLF